MSKYNLFVDGGCWPNPGGTGGWAYILRDVVNKTEFKKSGSLPNSTNNRAELTAVIKGIRKTPDLSSINMYSDSQYVVKGICGWMYTWAKRDWVGVKNADLWQILYPLVLRRDVHPIWIRGHNGHPENEECDKMCLIAANRYKGG